MGSGAADTPETAIAEGPATDGRSAEREYQLELSRQLELTSRELGYFSLEEREVYDSYTSEVLETLLEDGDIRAYPALIGRYSNTASLEYLTWASFTAAVHGSTPAIGMLAHLELSQARYEQLMENHEQARQRLVRSQALYRAAERLGDPYLGSVAEETLAQLGQTLDEAELAQVQDEAERFIRVLNRHREEVGRDRFELSE